MDARSIITVQRRIDAKAYPPTHQYDVRTLTAKGVLAQREKKILKICPDFYHASSCFLDVGASKGYFSLKAAQTSAFVVAVEPDKEALEAWTPVVPNNMERFQTTFGRIKPKAGLSFDVIWMGNGHHYAHREDPSGWLERLAALAVLDARVVIEGPVGPEARGFKSWEPGTVPVEKEWLGKAAELGLELRETVASPSYTPGRAIWYLRKV